jgi:predicted NBD/HSP70 family sugar kinase
MMQLIFDMGATKTRFALVTDGEIGDIIRVDTDRGATGFAKFLGAMDALVADRKIDLVVGGLPGQLEGDDGELAWAANLPQWIGLPIRARIEKLFSCRTVIFNDVVLGGIGECHYGAGSKEGVTAFFTVSTGVNGVRIVNGWPDEGIVHYEVGQQLIADSKGKFLTWESRVGGAALEKRYGKLPGEIKDPEVWRAETRSLSGGIYNTLLYWNPEVIVFSGSMMRDVDLEALRGELESLPKVLPDLPKLARAKLGDNAGLHGALAYIKNV